MSAPLRLSALDRLPPVVRADVVAGLDARLDAVAARAAEGHRFLRHGWFAAALAAYGGHARTLVVEQGATPVLALPFIEVGPAALGLAAIPGSYWPFRSFPLAPDANEGVLRAALSTLGEHVRGLRIGPVHDDDASAEPLIAAARAAGWTVLDRTLARSWRLDLPPAAEWPRASTLRKNRFHEKHLAGHGALAWRGRAAGEGPAGCHRRARGAERPGRGAPPDGRDAKFTPSGHGAFWRAAAADPVLAESFRAALLTVDGRPAAFSFDLDMGAHRHAIANSYDPAIARHSPGRLLHYRNLVDARARGTQVVDWGAGDSGYKQALGAVPGAVIRDWLLLRPGPSGWAGRWLARGWRASGRAI